MAIREDEQGSNDQKIIISCPDAGYLFLGMAAMVTRLWLFVFLIIIPLSTYGEGPWGKDADLVQWGPSRCCAPRSCETPLMGSFAETMIRFHQEVISPADGPRSYHKPSSSQYTLDAMRKYGFFRGFLMGCDRLMRENDDPWIYPVVTDAAGDAFKWDPVR